MRLLQTLVELGYATRISREAGYRLTDKVLGLAQGIRFVDHLIDVAAPHMSRFTRELRLAALSRHDQRSRHDHPPFDGGGGPMSFERTALQRRSPILSSALGRAWLAFCSAEDGAPCCAISACRQARSWPPPSPAIRRDGYAFTVLPRSGRLQGIGVAIRDGERVMGCLSMRFIRSAMTEEEAGRRYGAPLNALAAAIAADAER